MVPDLLAEIASGRPKDQAILGFAALTGNDIELEQLGRKKMQSKGCDLLMANPIDRIGQGFGENSNSIKLIAATNLFQKPGVPVVGLKSN